MENKVLATVNGIEITNDILESTIALLPPERRSYFESDFAKKQLLEQLIGVELISAHGTELGLDEDPQFLSQVEQAVKDVKYSFTMNKVFSAITIDEEEARKKFESNPSSYQGQEVIRASHILVDDEKLAEELIGKLEKNEITFEDAAMEYSSCPSKENGGDLGEFGRGMMVKEFEDVAFALEEGELTKKPVSTQFGFHVIKTTEKANAGKASFDDAKKDVMNKMLQDKQMEYYTNLITELKKKFEVKVNI